MNASYFLLSPFNGTHSLRDAIIVNFKKIHFTNRLRSNLKRDKKANTHEFGWKQKLLTVVKNVNKIVTFEKLQFYVIVRVYAAKCF